MIEKRYFNNDLTAILMIAYADPHNSQWLDEGIHIVRMNQLYRDVEHVIYAPMCRYRLSFRDVTAELE